jgi:hypothetical protein
MSPTLARADSTQATSVRRTPFVQNILPFLASLVLHVSLILLGLITYRAITIVVEARSEPPAVLPQGITEIAPELSNLPQFRGLTNDPTRRPEQDKIPDVPDTATGMSDNAAKLLALTQSGGLNEPGDDAIALGLKSSFGHGENLGAGTEGGPGLAPTGLSRGGSSDVAFLNTPPIRGVHRLVFLCDASGSMMNKFDALRQELRKAIDHLRPIQSFDVIFFSADRYVALDKQLVLAIPEAKRKAFDFLDKTAPHDSSDPIPGLRAAFATQPELIYLLTDGDFSNNDQVLEEIRKLNKDKKVQISTIAFMDRGEAYEKLLQQIADDNRGTFKFVSEQDLNP